MNHLQNLHTHTTYDDGKNLPEELIAVAIEKGFSSIGFSGHSYMHFSPKVAMSIEATEDYKKEISLLKEKYAEKIDVFCGLEFEINSCVDLSGFDYLIGSVHYFKIDDKYVAFDVREFDRVRGVIDNYFGGDGIKFAKAYYESIATLPEYGKFDIIGHFDLVTKHCENGWLFDRDCKEYLRAAIEAAEKLQGKIPLFEVNTGAIARGYRTSPYPAVTLMKEFKRLGYGAVISSDCHDAQYLDCHFKEAEELLKMCGFKEKYILTNEGFTAVELDV